MKRWWIVWSLVLAVAMPAAAAVRTLEDSYSAVSIDRVVIEAGVGDVNITAVDGDAVVVDVTLKARRGGFFSSMRRAEREVEEANLEAEVDGRELRIKIDSDSDERRFEESWVVTMPARMVLELEVGVGDVRIRGVGGGVALETGVGEVSIEVGSGDVTVEVGVGEVEVRAPASAYGSAEASSGVGAGVLRVLGQKIEGEGFVGSSSSWRGDGPDRIEVEVGVGDAEVVLE